MRCFDPIRIRNPKKDVFNPDEFIFVPCGCCSACLEQKANSWGARLEIENRASDCSYFITLTYAPEHIVYNENGVPYPSKEHFQKFMKRLRKHVEPYKIRYYAVSEYGQNKTLRPHFHLLLFRFPLHLSIYQIMDKSWDKGFYTVGEVTPASIRYVSYYIHKKSFVPPGGTPTFSLMSRRPGIGFDYLNPRKIKWHKSGENFRNYIVKEGGQKVLLPRYLRDKIFRDYERRIMNRQIELDNANKILGRPAEYFEQNPHLYDDVRRQYEDKIQKQLSKHKTL